MNQTDLFGQPIPSDKLRKIDVLKTMNFGSPVAEDEKDSLQSYFLETELWARVYKGEADLILGPKGGGKSAIFLLLQDKKADLKKHAKVDILSAENIRGDAAFKSLVNDPPSSEREIEVIWRLYFVALVAQYLIDAGLGGRESTRLTDALLEARLISRDKPTLAQKLASVRKAAMAMVKPKSISGTFSLTEAGLPVFGGQIDFDRSQQAETSFEDVEERINDFYRMADSALAEHKLKVWILIDRLDVAFEEDHELEKNALRGLLRSYLNIKQFDNIFLKVFLRSDIFARITQDGFREATHITRLRSIDWSRDSIRNIIIRRALANPGLRNYYGVDAGGIEKSADRQDALFNRIFPEQVEVGEKKPKTLDWIIKRISDGRGTFGPRDAIIFMTSLVELQAKKLELGDRDPQGEALFDRVIFKDAYRMVSDQKRDRVLFAEYPTERKHIEALRGKKTDFTLGGLQSVWKVSLEEALRIANRLLDIGFFEKKTSKDEDIFSAGWVYRPGLGLKQGLYSYEQ